MVDLATNKPGKLIKASYIPVAVAVAPDGRTAYVANYGTILVTPINVAGHAGPPDQGRPRGPAPSRSPRTGGPRT